MLLACDIDGTIDSDPQTFQALCEAFRAIGGQVAVLTGIKTDGQLSPQDVQEKQDYLKQIGFSAFDTLAVFPDGPALAQDKADWCAHHGADVLIDNNRGNAQAAQDVCLVLVPWATRMGKKKDGLLKAVEILKESAATVTIVRSAAEKSDPGDVAKNWAAFDQTRTATGKKGGATVGQRLAKLQAKLSGLQVKLVKLQGSEKGRISHNKGKGTRSAGKTSSSGGKTSGKSGGKTSGAGTSGGKAASKVSSAKAKQIANLQTQIANVQAQITQLAAQQKGS